jgi:putative SOS response-associated peptidase YedK
MPVILLPEQEDDWLNPDLTEPQDILGYLRPYPDALLVAERAA